MNKYDETSGMSLNDIAYKMVNVLLVERNWFLGKRLANAEDSKAFKDATKEKYFDRANLYHYLQFYKLYSNFVDSVSRQSLINH